MGAYWAGEGQVLLHVLGVAAGLRAVVDIVHEGLVKVEETSPFVDKGNSGNILKKNILSYTGVVKHDTLHIVVGRVVFAQHGIRDVRDVASGV